MGHTLSFAAAVFLVAPSIAQCTLDWQPGPALPGPGGIVRALVELQNGELLAGGTFTFADASRVDHLARWNGTQWLPFHGGTDGNVLAIVVLPNGEIVIGGTFQRAGGTNAANLARFDGVSWHPLGTGADAAVFALHVMPNGDLIVAGGFSILDGVPASRIGLWNSSGFQPLGSGVDAPPATDHVMALASLPNGDLAIGGLFTSVGGNPAWFVARWNGASWTGVPAFQQVTFVTALTSLPNGDLIIGHDAGIVRWDGTAAHALGTGVQGGVFALTRDGNGDVVVGGQFLQAGGVAARNVARWDGTSWHGYGAGRLERTNCLLRANNGTTVVGGGRSGSMAFSRAVAAWSPVAGNWTEFGASGLLADYGSIRSMVRIPNGDVVVGGSFTAFHGIAANRIVRWDGSAWAPLGAGLNGDVTCIAGAPNGDVIVGGSFTQAGGIPATYAARWNGTAWSALGGGLPAIPRLIAVGENVVFVAHNGATPAVNIVSLWAGAGFTPIGTWNGTIQAMVAIGVEPIVAGLLPGGNVQRWNGVWSPVGTLPNWPFSLLVTPDGSLVAGGTMSGGGVRRWDGTNWLPVGNLGPVPSVTCLANGELVAAGSAPYPDSLMLWNGAFWQSMGDGAYTAMRVVGSGHGDLFATGPFFGCGGLASAQFARASTPCPAVAAPYGAGCVGNGGPVELVVRHRPWLGSTFVAEARGIPLQALVVHALGLQPMVAPLPLGGSGCAAYVVPLLLDLLVPTGDIATAMLAVPSNTALIGAGFVQQVVVLELDTAGTWLRTTSSNALALQVGEL